MIDHFETHLGKKKEQITILTNKYCKLMTYPSVLINIKKDIK